MGIWERGGKSREYFCKLSTAASASAAVVATEAVFYGINITTDGVNDVLVQIYDNASAASGSTLFPAPIRIPGGNGFTTIMEGSIGILCANGIYVSITTAGTTHKYQVKYQD